MNKTKTLILFLAATLVLGSCFFFVPGCRSRESETLTILTWNVENLFDDVDNGSEYREYKPGDTWTTRDFHQRMVQLSRVIEAAVPGGPDVVLLQEVENQNVLATWNSRFLKNFGYKTVLAAPSPGAATIGILSRFPLSDYRLHRHDREGASPGRPITEMVIQTPGGAIRIFNNHWKSKSGGADETEPLRRAAAEALNQRLNELSSQDYPVILGGDFNESHDEFYLRGAAIITALMAPEPVKELSEEERRLCLVIYPLTSGILPGGVSPPPEDPPELYTPWPLMEGGTYHYSGNWERIDNFFLSGDLRDGRGWEWEDTAVIREPWMLTARGTPRGWNRETGEGFSDHLPLLLSLRFHDP